MDSLRIRVAFICSCIIHFLILSGLKIIPVNKPIIISFPVELISLPSYEKKIEDKIVIPEHRKKEEIVLPKKKQKKVVEKKVENKSQEQSQQEQQKEISSSSPTTLPSLSLETAKFPFTYYVNQIRKKIVENWLWSQSYPGELKTVVYFKILRSGEVVDLKIKESSSNKLYDNICIRAIEVAKPLPPLPDGFKEEYLGVYFEFKYKE
ncbi:MAG: TonB C-terminal domain-containing protein [Endomicrobia bacterium]|nr:TonB C-terminal domain-containing protein [Endomicrobiia bacterium]